MGLASIEFHNHAFARKIDNDVEHTRNFHQHWPKLAHAFVAIFALSRDLDRLNNCVIRTLRIERITRFRFVRSRGVHQLLNVRQLTFGRLISADAAPNMCFLSS